MSRSRIGRSIGKYRIVELLGRGGMAEVYKGYQENLDRFVAIKIMHSFLAADQDFLGRFKREAKAMAALNHPNIVGVYDFDVVDENYFIVMEYVGAGTLKHKLEQLANKGDQLAMADAVGLILQIADALAYAHSRGMFHRDIKPANILMSEAGNAILTDFGIAKMLSGPSHTATGSMIGTPAYMSPEQGLGQPGDHRSDLYSLGVLFFQMVTGRMPFDADTPLAIVMKHVNEPVPEPVSFNPDVPEVIQRIVVKALAKNPDERYQSATEMARDLRRAVRDTGVELAAALPAELLRDHPTPPPASVVHDETPPPAPAPLRPVSDKTLMGGQATRVSPGADATRVAPGTDRTHVAPAPHGPPAPLMPPAPPRRRSGLLWLIGGFLLVVIAGGVAGAMFLPGLLNPEPTPTVLAAVGTPIASSTPTTAATVEPTELLYNAATFNAELTQTAEARPTSTATATPVTPTETPAPSATPDGTATALASCAFSAEFVQFYTYSNRRFSGAAQGVTFPLNIVLRNTGSCPYPAGASVALKEGESFGDAQPVALTAPLQPGAEFVFTTTAVAPARAGGYDTTWQLLDAAGAPYGIEFEFRVNIFVPASPTPVPPTRTPTPVGPTRTPTPSSAGPLDFGWQFRDCSYVGELEFRCTLVITPRGGVGPPYTVFVFDRDPPARYFGEPTTFHFFQGRRCNAWVNTIRIQDEGGSQPFERALFFDPAQNGQIFPGGQCTLPGG